MTERVRRAPPPFRDVTVREVERITPRLVRVTLGGPGLAGFEPPGLAASVRLLLSDERPTWNGNEFLLRDGSRPPLRTLTPLRFSAASQALDVEVVEHGGGVLGAWASSASEGATVGLSGPGRGYEVDPAAPAYLLAGDETALPAIGQLLEAIPRSTPVEVHVEIAEPSARIEALRDTNWHVLAAGAPPGDALVGAVTAADIPDGARVWVAGEAAAVQRIRRHLFSERGLSRSQATVRGYWKHGRAGDAGDDAS